MATTKFAIAPMKAAQISQPGFVVREAGASGRPADEVAVAAFVAAAVDAAEFVAAAPVVAEIVAAVVPVVAVGVAAAFAPVVGVALVATGFAVAVAVLARRPAGMT